MDWFEDWKARVRAADAALGVADPVAAAQQLRARTVSEPRAFTWREVKGIGLRSGDWAKVVKRADGRTPSASQPELAAVDAAINAVSIADDEVFAPGDTDSLASLGAGLAALVAAGDLQAATAARIAGLGAVQKPEFDPPPSEHDLVTLRSGG